MRTAQTAIETWYTDEQNYTVAADGAELKAIEPSLNSGAGASLVVVPGTDTYTVTVTSKTNNKFSIAKTGAGAVTRSCTTIKTYGCPSGGATNW